MLSVHPHYEHWRQLPELVRNGVAFFKAKVMGAPMGIPRGKFEPLDAVATERSGLVRSLTESTGAAGDHEIGHDKNLLRFPYVSIFLRSHDLHLHPYRPILPLSQRAHWCHSRSTVVGPDLASTRAPRSPRE